MSVKHAFFSIFQKIMVICCAIFFGITHAFSANLPAGYTELEYIQSDGASYLIVPYRVNNKTVFYARYNETQKGTSVASCIFGVTDAPDVSKANYGILRLLNGTNNFNRMGWGDSTSGSIINVNAPQNLDTWYEVLYDQNKLYQNGRFYTTSATQPSTSWTANYDLGIFARNGSSVTMPAITKISSVWAKENGEYKINLVPAKRNSDNVLGMYDVVSGEFFTNQGTGEFTAGPVVPENPIKIATTAYNSARFSPVVTDLNTTIATIRDVVTNTINQTAAIADLQATKQTRPADDYTDETNTENCPKFRQCLLVEDNNNIPHWYLIKDPVRDLVKSLRDNKINSAGETTTTAYAANGYDGTNGTVDSRYYKGYVAMRKLADGSTSVYTRQFGVALTGGDNGGQYKTLDPQEWAVTWNGNETGTAGSFLPGVIYGTSRCAKTKPSSTAVGTDGWTTIENSDPVNDAENIQSYVQCYCKMIGVGVDGDITPVKNASRAPWVFRITYGSATDCAYDCSYLCAGGIRGYASIRQRIMDWAVE